MEILGTMLGGLGLVFLGIKMIQLGLRELTSRRFRQLMGRSLRRDSSSALAGALAGFFTQSGAIPSFVVASLVNTGMLTVRRGLPAIVWVNVGVVLVVPIAVLDIKTGVMIALGLGAICYVFERPARFRNIGQAVMGVSLLYFGLHLLRAGAEPMSQLPWFQDAVAGVQGSLALAFLVGVVLTVIVQSGLSVVIIAIALASTGILQVNATLMVSYGCLAGSCIVTWVLASGFKGSGRQLIMANIISELTVPALLVPLLLVEIYTGLPLVKALSTKFSSNLASQLALVPTMGYMASAIICTVFADRLAALLTRLWPPVPEEELSRVAFLQQQALADPSTATALLDREQQRYLSHLPLFLEDVRTADERGPQARLDQAHQALAVLAGEMNEYLAAILRRQMSADETEYAAELQARQELLGMLEQVTFDLATLLASGRVKAVSSSLGQVFLEALDTVLLTAAEAMSNGDELDIKLLLDMTAGRSKSMRRIREAYLTGLNEQSAGGREALVEMTSGYERAAWVVHQLARHLEQSQSWQESVTNS